MSADAIVKSYIDRILRLKEEQDTLAADIREVYAEAKGHGYDKTALGEVVSYLRKIEKKGRDAVDERTAMFDLYLSAYEQPSHTHAPARTREGQSYAQAKGIDVPSFVALTSSGGAYRYDAEITEHEQPETATRPGQDVQSPIQRASADENLDVTAGETATKLPLQTSPETGSAGDPSPTSGQMDLVEAGTGQNCAVLPQEPCTAQITPSAATPAEPEAVSPTPPAASGTISPSSDIQEVPGGNLSKPSPDAGAEDGSAHAGHSTAQSEQAAHHFDDVPAFLKQERAERQPNPKCRKPGDCKWDHGQVSCWRCNSAPAARESEVA